MQDIGIGHVGEEVAFSTDSLLSSVATDRLQLRVNPDSVAFSPTATARELS